MKPAEAEITLSGIGMVFSDRNGGLEALSDVSFSVRPREFVAVLGPSGSGKTTLLKIVGGLLRQTNGEVIFRRDGNSAWLPRVGLVFQQANLMPWRNVLENISLPLEMQGTDGRESERRSMEMVDLVGLRGFETSWPRDLSGGMAQRVALARALIQDPDLLLLDEPFGSLDALTRERMGAELLHIWQEHRKTVILVTHSISEALLLSDRVLVLTPRPGRVSLDLTVKLSRPRQDGLRYTPEFSALSRRLKAAIG